MAHRSKKTPKQQIAPVKKAIIGVAALVLGIMAAAIAGTGLVKSLVKNLPWNVW